MEINNVVIKRLKEWLSDYVDFNTKLEIIKEVGKKGIDILNEMFLEELEFGTGGLRGIIRPGTNGMNIYTVGKATTGIANYIKKINNSSDLIAVVSYDTRKNSLLFAKITSQIFAYHGIRVKLFREPTPTPVLSYAVRKFNADVGVMITASHNPPEYNGYKVYNKTGAQIISPEDKQIIEMVKNIKSLKEIKFIDFEEALKKKKIEWISDTLIDNYLDDIDKFVVDRLMINKAKNLKIVYTSLHGTGITVFQKLVKKYNLNNVYYPDEQIKFDSNFSTVKVPNPEEREALNLAIKLGEEKNADIILATDPDSDRLGVCFKDKNDYEYYIPDGNEIGIAFLYYILSYFKKNNSEKLKNSFTCNTIVTSDLQVEISKSFGVPMHRVLTGFKYIGDTINKNPDKTFLFAAEESYGYLIGDHVRDKDGLNAALLAIELAAYLKFNGITFKEFLQLIYKQFGYYKNLLISKRYEGIKGKEKINLIMQFFRKQKLLNFGEFKSEKFIDYLYDNTGLPASNVIQYIGKDFKITIRPSGTEPKIKYYFQAKGVSELETNENINRLMDNFFKLISEK